MERKALTDKIFCIGIDGMDPRLTRKYVDEGKLPNVKKLIERGACRHDLAMVGAMPTVTPPMWTTLCYRSISKYAWDYLFFPCYRGTR